MSSLSRLLVLFTVALSVSALATPRVARSPHDHHALAARMAAPAVAPAVGPYGDDLVKVVKPKRRKRGDTDRCRARSSTAAESSSSSSVVSTSSASSEAPAPTTPVQAVAADPAPSSSSSTWTPESSSTWAAETTWAAATTWSAEIPAPSTTSGGGDGGFLSGTQSGQATWYDVGLGACGITNNAGERIAAVSHELFDNYPGWDHANPNDNPVCNKKINVNFNGKSTTVTVTDRCEACKMTDLDFSISAFQDLADLGAGRLDNMSWNWA